MGSKKVTLTIDGIDTNEKKSSTKIPYVNPNASDDVMRTFANKCAALSTDTHTATTKTTDEDITTATPQKPKFTFPVNENGLANLQVGKSDSILLETLAVWMSTKANLPKIYCAYGYTENGMTYNDLAMTFGFGVEQILDMSDPSNCQLKIYLAKNSHTDATLTVDFLCTETPVTRETMYRLTITGTAGEATFVQL